MHHAERTNHPEPHVAVGEGILVQGHTLSLVVVDDATAGVAHAADEENEYGCPPPPAVGL